MNSDKKTLIIPVLLITFGIGSLLTTLGIAPQIDWAWTLVLALTGVLAFVLGGIDKVSVAVGPIFIIASLLSTLRQTGRISIDIEIPVLVIAAGVLLLIARSNAIPAPEWLQTPMAKPQKQSKSVDR